MGVRLKLSPIRQEIDGKRIAVIDDSIVRGLPVKISRNVKKEWCPRNTFLVSSPPHVSLLLWHRYFGAGQLIAAQKELEEIRNFISADSLNYLSQKGLFKAMGKAKGFCSACLDGDYPILIPPPEELGKHILETGKGEKICARLKG